jgi:hypothetical protein
VIMSDQNLSFENCRQLEISNESSEREGSEFESVRMCKTSLKTAEEKAESLKVEKF